MKKLVAVLGGGIGGLSACHHLSKSPNVSKVKQCRLKSSIDYFYKMVNQYLYKL